MRIPVLLAALTLGLAANSSAAANDRVFADGFDPCCTLGGQASGLSGSGLVLHLAAAGVGEDRPIPPNGGLYPLLYRFARTLPPGTGYTVSIATQPAGQTCTLANASGSVGTAPVDDIDVDCGADLIWDDGDWDSGSWQ